MKLALIGITSALATLACGMSENRSPELSKKKSDNNGNITVSSDADAGLSITKSWELPGELLEISGLAHMDDRYVACIQDEEGVVFIYDKINNKIARQVKFAGPGDYEGITLVGNGAYVVRSDGRVFEITDLSGSDSPAKEYATPLSVDNNVEGLCYDKANNRLLIAVKSADLHRGDAKGIYAFDLSTKKFIDQPVYVIEYADKAFASQGSRKSKSVVSPSAIAVHPTNSDLYVVDGPNARLLVLDRKGSVTSLYDLGKNDFPQAEGITFSEKGDIYISSEGKKKKGGTIRQVVLNR